MTVTALAAPKKSITPRVVDSYTPSADVAISPVAILKAGQNTDVGTLFVDPMDGGKYLVTYKLTVDGYYFSQIHFEAINNGDEAYIYSNGGIVPGKLTVNQSFTAPSVDAGTGVISGTREYSFLYMSGAEVTDFAAHSVVCKVETNRGTIQNGTKTETGYFASGAGDGAVLVREPFVYADPTTDPFSVWDKAFSTSPDWASKLIASGARFIWNTELSSGLSGYPGPTSNPSTVNGDVFYTDVPISVPTDATGIEAMLYIVADNGYIAKIDDQIINSAGFNAGAYAALSDDLIDDSLNGNALLNYVFTSLTPYDTKPLFVESVVLTNAWQSMIAVGSAVPLIAGQTNTINIVAINEQMNGGNDYTNPAGVIFFIEYSWVVPNMVDDWTITLASCETAWGAGTGANGSNWSQVIINPYTVS